MTGPRSEHFYECAHCHSDRLRWRERIIETGMWAICQECGIVFFVSMTPEESGWQPVESPT